MIDSSARGLTFFRSVGIRKENVNHQRMLTALMMLAAATTAPPPPRITASARARIIRATRISFATPQRAPETALIRRGMIEFR